MTRKSLRAGDARSHEGRSAERLARLYRVLSRVTAAVEGAEDEATLLEAACATVVDVGRFLMSWAGVVDGATGEVRPVASAGHTDGYVELLRVRLDGERSAGPTGQALRERRTTVCHDVATDPRMALWRDEALRRGYATSVALPLMSASTILGVLTVYADRPARFDADEIALLEELGRVVSFGLERLAARRREREAEAALMASRELFEVAVETMLDAFGIYSAVRDETDAIVDFRVAYVNDAACATAGTTCGHLLGRRALDIAPEWRTNGGFERYRRLVEQGDPLVEASVIDGGPFWRTDACERIFDVRAFKVKDGFAQTWRDVTDRRVATQALQRSEAELRAVQRFATLASWTWDAATNEVSCSDEYYSIAGLDPSSAGLVSLDDHRALYAPDSWARLLPLMERAARFGAPYDVDLEIVRPDGTRRWITSHGIAVDLLNGRPRALRGIVHDITDRKAAEDRLAASERTFRTSVETLLDPFVLLRAVRDDAGQIVDFVYDYANDAACRSNRMAREELVGARLLDVLPEHDRAGLLTTYAHVVETGQPLVLDDFAYVDAWGGERMERVFDVRANAAGDTLAYTWRDVTDRRQSERRRAEELEARVRARTAELEAANAELERLRDAEVDRAALEERTRLGRELHDGLAQQLWLAKLKAQRLLTLPGLAADARLLADEVAMAVDAGLAEASWAVQALRPDGAAGSAAFEARLRRTVEEFGGRFGVRAELQSGPVLPTLAPRVEAELLRIAQEALTNVQRHADATVVQVQLGRRDDILTMRVRDNGCGFDVGRVEGAAYGLASMRERAGIAGGKLTIGSAPGAGTCITVEVPI